MGLEVSVDYIDDLDSASPAAGDVLSQADDHMRFIKKALKQTFPGAGGQGFAEPILVIEDELNLLFGLTAEAAELNLLDGTTIGAAVASKVLAVDANRDINNLRNVTAAAFIGALAGNAASASIAAKWTTARNIALTGDIIGNGNIDGSANLSFDTQIGANKVTANEIAASSVGASEIAANAVNNSEMGSSAIHRAELFTTTASVGGTIGNANNVNITMNAYCFFPMIYFGGSNQMQAHSSDGGSADAPRFSINGTGDGKSNITYAVDHRYVRS